MFQNVCFTINSTVLFCVIFTVIPSFCFIPTERRFYDNSGDEIVIYDMKQPMMSDKMNENFQENQMDSEFDFKVPIMLQYRQKKGERVCGSRFLKTLAKLCSNCTKKLGTEFVPSKRDGSSLKTIDEWATKCCEDGCEFNELRHFCCTP
uniref:Insulin-like domain-containing protein n=1 Tax=Panagrolaimus sp. JU765 TaxID=591449 RepID=A0AC34QQX4_9BILA